MRKLCRGPFFTILLAYNTRCLSRKVRCQFFPSLNIYGYFFSSYFHVRMFKGHFGLSLDNKRVILVCLRPTQVLEFFSSSFDFQIILGCLQVKCGLRLPFEAILNPFQITLGLFKVINALVDLLWVLSIFFTLRKATRKLCITSFCLVNVDCNF